jgi:hypothetical protein
MFNDQLTGATNQSAADIIRLWHPGLQAYVNAYKADHLTAIPARNGHWFTDFTSWSSSPLSFYPEWCKNSSVTE